jgi:hypothetical protein
MAIALRGISQTGSGNNGNDVTLTFDTITPPQTDDYVIVAGGHGDAVTTLTAPSPNAGGAYTQIAINTGVEPIFGVWIKKMEATPNTSVLCAGSGNNADATAYCCATWSGVDTVTAQDAAAITVGPTTSTNPNCGSITTVTANAFVLAIAGSAVFDSSPGTVSGYTDQISVSRNDTNDISVALARIDAGAADAEDPPAWGTWASGAWYAVTVALRPAAGAAFATGPKILGARTTFPGGRTIIFP